MKEFTLVPTTDGFTGNMVISVPTYSAKLSLLKELGLKVSQDGTVNMQGIEEKGLLSVMEVAIAKVMPMIKSVDLKFGEAVVSKEDLEYYEECMPLMMEVFMILVKGLSLGKK